MRNIVSALVDIIQNARERHTEDHIPNDESTKLFRYAELINSQLLQALQERLAQSAHLDALDGGQHRRRGGDPLLNCL